MLIRPSERLVVASPEVQVAVVPSYSISLMLSRPGYMCIILVCTLYMKQYSYEWVCMCVCMCTHIHGYLKKFTNSEVLLLKVAAGFI